MNMKPQKTPDTIVHPRDQLVQIGVTIDLHIITPNSVYVLTKSVLCDH